MFYPEEFKKRCKEIYPWHKELHKFLETGDHKVGRILEDGVEVFGISFDEILKATSLEELKKRAEEAKVRALLYDDWIKLDNANRYRIYKN